MDNYAYMDYFRKMYHAHETIANIGERLNRLYESATRLSPFNDGMRKQPNPHRFENTLCEIADLKTIAEDLLKQRARFDVFISGLRPFYKELLDLKYESNAGWKCIAATLDVSINSAHRIYGRICQQANELGYVDTKLVEVGGYDTI
jgi:hypothetical protein